MANEVQVFDNLKVKEVNGQVMFDAETAAIGMGLIDTSKGTQKVRWGRVNQYLRLDGRTAPKVALGDFITESQLYKLAIKANNPVADRFQDWVTEEVVPAIRKTGSYQSQPALRLPKNNAEMLQVVQNVNEETNKRIDEVENSVSKLTDEFGLPNKSAGKLRNYGNQRVTWWLGGKQSNAYQEISSKVFAEFWHDFKMYFGGLSSYKDLPMKDMDRAETYIQNWHPSTNTQAKISELNLQTELDV